MGVILELPFIPFELLFLWAPLFFVVVYVWTYLHTRQPPYSAIGNFFVDPHKGSVILLFDCLLVCVAYRLGSGGERVPFAPFSDAPTCDVTLVVPAYNEAQRLPKMLDETLAYLNYRQRLKPSFTWEIIVVNDGSRDDTVAAAMKVRPHSPPPFVVSADSFSSLSWRCKVCRTDRSGQNQGSQPREKRRQRRRSAAGHALWAGPDATDGACDFSLVFFFGNSGSADHLCLWAGGWRWRDADQRHGVA